MYKKGFCLAVLNVLDKIGRLFRLLAHLKMWLRSKNLPQARGLLKVIVVSMFYSSHVVKWLN